MRRLALCCVALSLAAILAACSSPGVSGGNLASPSAWSGTWKGHIDYQSTANAGYHSDLTLQVSVNGTSLTGTGTVHTYNDAKTASFTVSGSFTGTVDSSNAVDAYLYCSTASGNDTGYQINSCSDLSWSSTHVVGNLTSSTTATVSLPDMATNTMIGDPAFNDIHLTRQ